MKSLFISNHQILRAVTPIFLLMSILSGCAPSYVVRVQYEAPPKFNTQGITRVAVDRFTSPNGQYYSEMAVLATERASSAISAIPQFTLVHVSPGQNIEGIADARLIGEITHISTDQSSEAKTRTVGKGDNRRTENYTQYTTKVEITYNYQIGRASCRERV